MEVPEGLVGIVSGHLREKCWREDSRKGKWAQIVKGWKALAFVLWVIMAFLSSEVISDLGFRRPLWLPCPV